MVKFYDSLRVGDQGEKLGNSIMDVDVIIQKFKFQWGAVFFFFKNEQNGKLEKIIFNDVI